ncbi:S8 family peptidase [Streptomyces brasiliensis]|uniref:S8 family peptidase n=1 Tax=Streptomyces brasiliensis TaxID=1954 RepID=UPI001670C483|nr:S8 family serine peptidase [Streptomyces brasiliensis]
MGLTSTAYAQQASPVSVQPASERPARATPSDTVRLSGVGGGEHTVTLITGDQVKFSSMGGDRYRIDPVPSVRADGSQARLYVQQTPDGVYALPSDAMPAIQAGRLDRELFDIKYLAEHGYADDATKQTPVIVQYPKTQAKAAVKSAATAIPASTPTHELTSIHAATLTVPKSDTSTFWTAVRAVPAQGGVTTLASPNALRGEIAKVWLDKKVTVTLDQSVPQIGAPQAWANGHDGSGVKVAILDTGIDDGHPDLAGKVDESKSFVPGVDSVKDGFGHGTHVADIIAGSGAASDGKYKGVAPGAKLIIGKVLDDTGSGDESQIIAGMEWAATTDAKIISMSLGTQVGTDGTDPIAQAVNDLSAADGKLFVIAAGNNGPGAETVSSPGSADAALTVAAVDKQDKLASFSSRGPRLGNEALKPNIAAPGVSITAARAAGTTMGTPVNDYYTTASGTSMATPHVAGAAAIIAQHHPDWSGPQIKAALMSSANDDGYSAYEQGAGRVDLTRADSQQVFATTPDADFGAVTDDSTTLTRQVTYRNYGDQPVTLTLATSLHNSKGEALDGKLTASDAALTVPANGTASTTLTLDPSGLVYDNYSGVVTAQADGIALRTPVGAVRQAPMATLTVHTIGRDGKPINPWAQDVIDMDGDKGDIGGGSLVDTGVVQVRVPQGTLSLTQLVNWTDDDNRDNMAYLSLPEFTITGDADVTLDLRQASQVQFSTPQPAEPLNNDWNFTFTRTTAAGAAYQGLLWDNAPIGAWGKLWALPTKPVTKGKFRFTTQWTLGRSETTMSIRKPKQVALNAVSPIHWGQFTAQTEDAHPDFRRFTGTQDLQVTDVGMATPEEIAQRTDLKGKLVLLEADYVKGLSGPECGASIEQIGAIRDAGAAGVAIFPNKDTNCTIPLHIAQKPFTGEPKPLGIPDVFLSTREGLAVRDQLASGPTTIRVTDNGETPYSYTFKQYEEGHIPASLHYTYTSRQLAQVDLNLHGTSTDMYTPYMYAFKQDEGGVNMASSVAFGSTAVTGAKTHREWVGPLSDDVIYEQGIASSGNTINGWRSEVFDKPVRTQQEWFRAPATPGPNMATSKVYSIPGADAPPGSVDLGCSICVQGNVLWADLSNTTGVGEDHDILTGAYKPDGALESAYNLHLYRDGKEISNTPPAGWEDIAPKTPRYVLPDGAATYTLAGDDGKNKVEWTFHSPPAPDMKQNGFHCMANMLEGSTEACDPEPVVYVSYDLGSAQGLDNTVRAGQTHTFTVQAYHSPTTGTMPAITSVKLWASTDDGTTWKPVSIRSTGDGTYKATTTYPALANTTGAVSLKVEASDAAGNTIKQTTTRAFQLRP